MFLLLQIIFKYFRFIVFKLYSLYLYLKSIVPKSRYIKKIFRILSTTNYPTHDFSM